MFSATKYNSDKEQKVDPRIIQKIQEALEAKGWNYSDLARAMNHTPAWVTYLMKGVRGLDINVLIKIAEKLKVDVASLLPNTSGEETPKNFEEYIESIMMDVFEKKIIPRIEEKLKKVVKS